MEKKLIDVLQEELGKSVQWDDTFEKLDVDSLEFVDLITKIEDAFAIRIDDSEFEHILTVADLGQKVRERIN